MKIGFLFPGQGSQHLGMGRDIYDASDSVKKIYDNVKNISGTDIAKISFGNDETELNGTKATQLAILAMSLGILEVLKENGITSCFNAGLSLGEYTALINAGVFNLRDGIYIVTKRGECMENYLPLGNWCMAAILGLKDEEVEAMCSEITTGFVKPVNYNCPGQVIISGDEDAVSETMKLAIEKFNAKVIKLKTAGPFHTEKLKKASEVFTEFLKDIEVIDDKKVSVVKNVDGEFYKDCESLYDILPLQMISPVKFSNSIETMINNGVDTFIEIGPGKTLSGFVKRINKSVKILNISDMQTLEATIQYIKENRVNE